MKRDFFLLTESQFHMSYLVSLWINSFGERNILIREELISKDIRKQRIRFHTKHKGKHILDKQELVQLNTIYPSLSNTELAMISVYGIPEYATTSSEETMFLGNDLNNKFAEESINNIGEDILEQSFLFIFLDQLLRPWWTKRWRNKIINAHSAVLPHARGMYAIENIALREDPGLFKKCSGATIHYIDEGIDTGPIIQSVRFSNPFQYTSLWELKAASFMHAYQLLIATATSLFSNPNLIPAGIQYDIAIRGKNFNSKDFSQDKKLAAEKAYLSMKKINLSTS